MNKCKNCNIEFEVYKRDTVCPFCDEGEITSDSEFFSNTCRRCDGMGNMVITETDFCCEDCLNEYYDEHHYIPNI